MRGSCEWWVVSCEKEGREEELNVEHSTFNVQRRIKEIKKLRNQKTEGYNDE